METEFSDAAIKRDKPVFFFWCPSERPRAARIDPMADDSKKRLLEYAAGRLGLKELAARLKVPEKTVEEWLHGSPDMTHSKALALADLINDLTKSK